MCILEVMSPVPAQPPVPPLTQPPPLPPAVPDRPLAPEDARTRARLVDAAGRVFAEQGYASALGKDIAALANTNPAAINYHFGGKDRLYYAVLQEAHRRLATVEQIRAIRASGKSPTETLKAVLSLPVSGIMATGRDSWHFRVVLREIAQPTAALEEMFTREMAPKLVEIVQIVAAVAELPPHHPAVRRCMMSLAAHIAFLFQNRFLIDKVLPDLAQDPNAAETMRDHIFEFCVAGIRAVAKKAGKSER